MSKSQRKLTPVPPGYDQFTPDVVRSNAVSQIVWHGRDAEAKQLDQAKEYLVAGNCKAVEIKMRIVNEIRHQLEINGDELLQQHYACVKSFAECEKSEAARRQELAGRIAAADRRARGGR